MLSGAQSGDFQLNPDRKNYNEKVNKKSETKKLKNK